MVKYPFSNSGFKILTEGAFWGLALVTYLKVKVSWAFQFYYFFNSQPLLENKENVPLSINLDCDLVPL
jgi:hypothetical protein